MHVLAAAHAASSGTSLGTIYTVVIVLVSILGTGVVTGAIAAWRNVKKKVMRENAIDQLIDPKTGVNAQFEQLRRLISPNGQKTDDLSNIARRTEQAVRDLDKKVDAQGERFERHVGRCDAEHQSLRRDLDRKADK